MIAAITVPNDDTMPPINSLPPMTTAATVRRVYDAVALISEPPADAVKGVFVTSSG